MDLVEETVTVLDAAARRPVVEKFGFSLSFGGSGLITARESSCVKACFWSGRAFKERLKG